jgi:hypothetical protein
MRSPGFFLDNVSATCSGVPMLRTHRPAKPQSRVKVGGLHDLYDLSLFLSLS